MKRALIRRHPHTLFADPFFRGIDRIFNEEILEPFVGKRGEETVSPAWTPAVDVRETPEAYVFTAELPGLTKEDIEITLEERVLTISGERSFEETEDKNSYHRVERAYGSFARSFHLPNEVDSEKVAAKFDSGLLTVSVAKAEQAKPRKIEIG